MWYRKTAMQGHVNAQFNLGILHMSGDGIPSDNVMCFIWFSIAAKSGDEEAKAFRDKCSEALSSKSLIDAQSRAATMFSEIHNKLQ